MRKGGFRNRRGNGTKQYYLQSRFVTKYIHLGNDVDRRKQAQHDDELSPDSDSGNEDEESSQAREERREERRQQRLQKRRERIEYSKAMDMQYELSSPC